MTPRQASQAFMDNYSGENIRVIFKTAKGEQRDYTGVIGDTRSEAFAENGLVPLWVEGKLKSFRIDKLLAYAVVFD